MKKLFFMTSIFVSIVLANTTFAICELGNTHFIAAIVNVEGNIEVWLNTRDHWIKNKSLIDSYGPDDSARVEVITDKLDLCNLAESQYGPCGPGRTAVEIGRDLLGQCVENVKEFQDWADKESH